MLGLIQLHQGDWFELKASCKKILIFSYISYERERGDFLFGGKNFGTNITSQDKRSYTCINAHTQI